MTTPVVQEALLERQLTELERARAWSPRLVSRLERLIRDGSDEALFRVNPVAFAKDSGLDEGEVIDLFLHAVKAGLFQMDWQLICPTCADTVKSFWSLRGVESHFYCSVCQSDTEATLDEFIHVGFTVAPTLRAIRFHQPDLLSPEEYHFRFRFHPQGRVPGGGPTAVDMFQGMTRHLSWLAPGEVRTVEVEAHAGLLVGCDLVNGAGFGLPIAGEPTAEGQDARITRKGSEMTVHGGPFRPGRVRLKVENDPVSRGALLVLDIPPHDAVVLEFPPALTGKRLLSLQTFRDLFRSEVVEAAEGIGVKNLTFVFTDLKGSTALYDEIGDLKAYTLVGQHFESLRKVINRHGGALVKTIGDAVMATFLTPAQGLQAATDMIGEIREFNRSLGKGALILKIGIHCGPSIVVTSNERLDYFGQSVNIASRVQELSGAEEISLTQDVYDAPGVKDATATFRVESVQARLKGIRDEMQVYRIALAAR